MGNFSNIFKTLRIERGYTQEQLAKTLNISRSRIGMYETGAREPDFETLEMIADFFNVDLDYLLGRSTHTTKLISFPNIHNIGRRSFPMLGSVACGKPLFADKEYDSYVMADADIDADYCLTASGDSMINARIFDGDIVFIKEMSSVDNGDIAVVVIDDDATLKRVYFYPETNTLQLLAENPAYAPLIYTGEQLDHIHIMGKAVFFQSLVK